MKTTSVTSTKGIGVEVTIGCGVEVITIGCEEPSPVSTRVTYCFSIQYVANINKTTN